MIITINDFHEVMTQAKEAQEQLPVLQTQLEAANKLISSLQLKVNVLENEANENAKTISTFNTKVRSLEVERNEADFRQLEVEDRLNNLNGIVAGLHTALGEVLTQKVVQQDAKAKMQAQAQSQAQASEPEPSIGHNSQVESPIVLDEPETQAVENQPPTTLGLEYLGHETWRKPNDVSWKTFIAAGGQRPYWLSDSVLESNVA
ncbi:MAG: hypothetical protein ACREHG_06175 [Candidatus Saccharimonadales bacterium]